MKLQGKRILLTGATGGIGEHIATTLAGLGAELILVARDTIKLERLQHRLREQGSHSHILVADFEQENAAERLITQVITRFGQVDVLINNAAILDFIQLQDQSYARIEQMIHTNVTSPIQLARAILPHFLHQQVGHFVMIGSIFGSLGFPHYATYCASKFAIHGFSQALRRELVDTKIGVTYVAPRGVKTPMNDAATTAMMEHTGNTMDAPEKVAAIIVDALIREKQEVFIGQPQSFFAWLNGVCPKLVNMGLKKQTMLAKPFVTRK